MQNDQGQQRVQRDVDGAEQHTENRRSDDAHQEALIGVGKPEEDRRQYNHNPDGKRREQVQQGKDEKSPINHFLRQTRCDRDIIPALVFLSRNRQDRRNDRPVPFFFFLLRQFCPDFAVEMESENEIGDEQKVQETDAESDHRRNGPQRFEVECRQGKSDVAQCDAGEGDQ